MNDPIVFIATIVTAFANVILALFTIRLANLTREMASETKRSREQRERADIQLAIEPNPHDLVFVELVIANVGSAAAKDVQIGVSVKAPDSQGADGKAYMKKFSISAVLPGFRQRLFLGSVIELTESAIVDAYATYRDEIGQHKTDLRQRLSGWFGFTRIGQDPAHEGAKALTKIAEVMRNVSFGSRLRVDVFGDDDRKAERAALDAQLARSRADKEPRDDVDEDKR